MRKGVAMNYDLYIFDYDGTVCNSFEGFKSSVAYMLEHFHLPVPSDDTIRSCIGPPLLHSLTCILKVDPALHEEASIIYRKHFTEYGNQYFSMYAGIRTVLQSLRQSGAKVALATSKPIGPTLTLLKQFGLTELFDSINAPENDKVKNSKEFAIGEALKVPHTSAVMIGDRKYDAQGAKFHNVDFVGVNYGFADAGELEATEAIAVAESPMDLLRIFNVPAITGKFISMEGMDGCGKTTQLHLLQEKLNKFGFLFDYTREPGGTAIGEKIRELVLSVENSEMCARTEALLYAAARAQHVEQRIKPSLQTGKHVLCDRFVDSSIAYQGGGRKLGKNNVQAINAFAIDQTMPDKTIYLSMDAEKSLQRRAQASVLDRLESEKTEFFLQTKAVYDALVQENPERFIEINADDTIENIADQVFFKLVSYLEPQVNWEACKHE